MFQVCLVLLAFYKFGESDYFLSYAMTFVALLGCFGMLALFRHARRQFVLNEDITFSLEGLIERYEQGASALRQQVTSTQVQQ